MYPAGVLSVLVTATTGQANASLRKTQTMFRATAATSESAAARSSAAWKKTGFVVAAGAAFAGAAAGKLSIDFEKSMRNVNSLAQLPEKNFQKLQKDVLALAGPTAQAPQTLSEGMYDLVSSGFDAKESLSIVKESAIAASAGLTDTKTSTKAVAAVLNAYRMPASNARKVSDQLFSTVNYGVLTFEDLAQHIGDTLPFASQLGVKLKEVGASTATMTKQGLSAPETMTRIRNVMQTLIKPGEDLKKTYKELGMSGEEMIKKFGFQGTLEKLAATTDGTKEEMAKLFPNIRALGGVLALTGGNAKAADKDLKRMNDTAGETARVFKEQSKSVAFQWQKAKAELAATAITVGAVLLPVFLKLIGVLKDGVNTLIDVGKWLSALDNPISQTIVTVAAFAAGLKVLLLLMNSAFIKGVISMTQTLYLLGLEFMSTAGASGVLAGALKALQLAFATNPFGMAVVGVGLLAGAFFGLKDALDSSGDSLHKMAHPYKSAMKQTDALRKSEEHLKEVHKLSKESSKQVAKADQHLQNVRKKYGENSQEAIDAENHLIKLKRRDERITHRLKEAEKLHGIERKATRKIDRQATKQMSQNIVDLKHYQKYLMRVIHQVGLNNMTDKQRNEIMKELHGTQKALGEQTTKLAKTQKSAATDVGPKFAKSLAEQSKKVKQVRDESRGGKQALDAFKYSVKLNTDLMLQKGHKALKTAADDHKDVAGRAKDAAHNEKDFGSTGEAAAKIVRRSVAGLMQELGIAPNKSFRAPPTKRKAQGGFMVPGHTSGDSVPVNLMLEPGETGFILNKTASSTLAALNKANKMFPRSRMAQGGWVDPAGPGHGVVNPAIAGRVGQWSTRYNAAINYGYDPGGGHVSPGHNVTGTATDTSPAAGWTPSATALFERGLRSIQNSVDQILYGTAGIGTPFPNHGRGNHAHIEWGMHPGGIAGGGMRIPKLHIQGPPGQLRTILQAAADEEVKAANQYIAQQMRKFGETAEAGLTTAGGMFNKSELANLWRRANGGIGNPNLMAAISLAESGGDPNAKNAQTGAAGLWQILGLPFKGNPFNPLTNARMAGAKFRSQGLGAWEAYTTGTYRRFMKEGGLVRAQREMKQLKKIMHGTAALDERIDIAETIAGRVSSPFGSDLSPDEIAKQVKLNVKLLKNLKKEARQSKHGHKMTDRILKKYQRGKDPKTQNLQRKLNQLKDRRASIRASERKKKHPNDNATNQVEREIEHTQNDIDKRRDELRNTIDKLKDLDSTFKGTFRDMVGVTGKGGRIFDAKNTLDELRHTSAGGLGGIGLTVSQLKEFADALRLGAFQTGLPVFHGGGIAIPGRAGQQEMAAILRKDEGVFTTEQMAAMGAGGRGDITVLNKVYVGDREIKDIVRTETKIIDRNAEKAYQAS